MFKRVANLFKGFLGLFVSGLRRRSRSAPGGGEGESPQANRKVTTRSLASHAGLCERLMSQVKKLETEERAICAQGGRAPQGGQCRRASQPVCRLQLQSTTTPACREP